MLQYLLNATAIWLFSLIIFGLFLRRETLHSFNRLYLLGSLLSGILHPVLTIPKSETAAHNIAPVKYSIEKTGIVQERVIKTITPAADASFDWELCLRIVYWLGVLVCVFLLLKEIYTLYVYYHKGRKHIEGKWVIVETGKKHSPFSLYRYLFVSDKKRYTAEEWNMIKAHEYRHYHLLHLADLLFLQAVKIVFWFHPLVYQFSRKLLLVHEYQADKVSAGTSPHYGQFLIEQSLLNKTPALSHAFSRSPLKNRIMMLKRKSANHALLKAHTAVPVVMLSVLFFSNCKNEYSAPLNADYTVRKEGNIARYKGNSTGLKLRTPDSTGTYADEPITLNGQRIYNIYKDKELETYPEFSIKGSSLGHYLFENLQDDFATLDDGEYNLPLGFYVINEKGELVFYDYYGMHLVNVTYEDGNPPPPITRFDDKIKSLLYNAPKFIPAKANGKPVPSVMSGFFGKKFYVVLVKNHKATLKFTGESPY